MLGAVHADRGIILAGYGDGQGALSAWARASSVLASLGSLGAGQAAFVAAHEGVLLDDKGNHHEAQAKHELVLQVLPHIEVWHHPHFASPHHAAQQPQPPSPSSSPPSPSSPYALVSDPSPRAPPAEEVRTVSSLLSAQTSRLGPAHPTLLPSLLLLATLQRLGGDPHAALLTLDLVRPLIRGELSHALLLAHQALVHRALGQVALHCASLRDALRLRRHVLGEHHLHVALLQADLAQALTPRGGDRPREAALLGKAAQLRLGIVLPRGHPYLPED